MFAFQDALGPVEVAFTDRHGGTSGGTFASLNLAEPGSGAAGSTEEERDAVRRNVEIVVAAFTGSDGSGPAPSVVRMRQVHGADVHVVTAGSEIATGDGLVTAETGTVLMVRVADCVPILLADPEARVVAAVHAGRPGMVAGVVPAAYAETSWGTPALDIGAGVHAQLADAGVTTVDASRCTIEDEDLFSYRRQGAAAGRLAGLVWVRP